MDNPPVLTSRKPIYTSLPCPRCSATCEFLIPTTLSPAAPKIACYSCNNLIPYNKSSPTTSTSNTPLSGSTPTTRKKFRPGTDSEPYSLEYYETLNLRPDATPAEIKKSYYALAMQYHPDKNPNKVGTEEVFKKISEAYQVLSDPVLRKKYNEYGPKGAAPEGGFMNPEEFFQAQFGGDRFIDIIGELAIAKHFKSAMAEAAGEEAAEDPSAPVLEGTQNGTEPTKKMTLEKRIEEMDLRKKERDERVGKLAENLIVKLKSYTLRTESSFRKQIVDETEELKVQNYGVQLLHSIGYVYTNKASEYLTKDELLGVTSFFHKMKMKGHAINETFSTIKSAVDVHKSFVQLQEAEKRGDGEEVKQRMEAEAARKGIEALWQGSKLEVESVLKSVCDRVLGDVEKGERKRRAEGIKIIGDIYRSVKLE